MSDARRSFPTDGVDADGNVICPECSDQPHDSCALCGNEGGED